VPPYPNPDPNGTEGGRRRTCPSVLRRASKATPPTALAGQRLATTRRGPRMTAYLFRPTEEVTGASRKLRDSDHRGGWVERQVAAMTCQLCLVRSPFDLAAAAAVVGNIPSVAVMMPVATLAAWSPTGLRSLVGDAGARPGCGRRRRLCTRLDRGGGCVR
jgi:hypothetical protein